MNRARIKTNGILLLDKPKDLTSNAALQRVKRLFNAEKAGHTGSLDPKATGMLPICFGEATKFSQFLLENDKYYQVEAKLGIKTTTGDAEGDIIAEKKVDSAIPISMMREVLDGFKGECQQIPPMYSAIKVNGKPLYSLARKGISIPRQPRLIHIYQMELVSLGNETFVLNIHCSKGTYIRTLIEDIGDKLGYGAYVVNLHRPKVAPYDNNKMYKLSELEDIYQTDGLRGLNQCLLAMDSSVQNLPSVQLSSAAAFYLRMGQSVTAPRLSGEGDVRIYSANAEFLGIGRISDEGKLIPCRLLKDPVSIQSTRSEAY